MNSNTNIMKRILVPTDFSPEAKNALEIAIEMAKTFDGEVILLNVVDVAGQGDFSASGAAVGSGAMDSIFTMKLIEKMKADMEEAIAEHEGAPISTELAMGDLHEMINERVERDEIDLVVIGSKGASGLQEVMVGSNAEKVVRLAACPVLTVKESSRDIHPNNIVFASDFTEELDKVGKRLVEFQKHYDATMHLLFVNTPNKFELSSESNRRMHDFAARLGIENYTVNVYNHRDEEDGILGFAEENNHDLIAVATHSRKGLAHLLSGSISEGVVNHSSKPVLSFSIRYLK